MGRKSGRVVTKNFEREANSGRESGGEMKLELLSEEDGVQLPNKVLSQPEISSKEKTLGGISVVSKLFHHIA